MRKGLLIAVALAVLGIAGLFAYRGRSGDAGDQIRISGNIELTEIKIAFKTAGRLIARAVDEGDMVKKGMVVARLDQDQLVNQLETQKAGLRSAESLRLQAATTLEWQTQTVAGDIEQRRADLSQAEAKLRELEAGSRPQEIQQASAAVDAARTEYERAQKDWERAQTLYKNEDISTSQFDQFRSRFEGGAAALKQAEQRLAMVHEGPRKEEIAVARAQVSRAMAALQMSEANRIDLKRRLEEITTRQAEVGRTHAQINLVQSQLQDTIAVSPIDGVVLVKSADVGEVLAPGATVVTLGDIDHPWLRGYIGEKDLGRVKLGMRAKVSTDSFPGKVYPGHVSYIASEAEFTPKQIQTNDERVKLVYRIKIDVENPRHELKLNMPADGEILVDGR